MLDVSGQDRSDKGQVKDGKAETRTVGCERDLLSFPPHPCGHRCDGSRDVMPEKRLRKVLHPGRCLPPDSKLDGYTDIDQNC